MSLNCVEIEKVIESFPQNGFIKKIFEIDKFTLVINLFNNIEEYFILCSIKNSYNRICLIPKKENLTKKLKLLRFSQSLNSNIKNGKIIEIYQYNYSRIVVINIQIQNSFKKLIFRLWSNGSNILLIDHNNKIIDCFRRMPKRGEWPNEIFIFPDKKNITLKDNFAVRKEFLNGNINNNIYEFYKNNINNENIDKNKNNLNQLLIKEIDQLKEKINKNNNISDDKEELYKKYGEFLKSNFHKIKKGDSDIEVEDYDYNKKINIPLDIKLTPADNIKKYFNMYKKIKHNKILWKKEKEVLIKRLIKLEKYIDLLSNIQDNHNLIDLENNIKNFLKINHLKTKKDIKKIPGRHFILDGGYNSYVSRNAKESYELLKTVAKGNDYWFHIRDYSGSHVIVKKFANKNISNKAKIEAANLAVHYSKYKNPEYADVYFSQVKYLHKQKGSDLGLVFPIREKNIKLKYNKDLVKQILNR